MSWEGVALLLFLFVGIFLVYWGHNHQMAIRQRSYLAALQLCESHGGAKIVKYSVYDVDYYLCETNTSTVLGYILLDNYGDPLGYQPIDTGTAHAAIVGGYVQSTRSATAAAIAGAAAAIGGAR